MYWFKQCPRCSGDLVVENDQYGIFVSCMQCGMCKDVTSDQFHPSQISLEPVPVPVVPPDCNLEPQLVETAFNAEQ